ncbi:MAG: hypothetical protein ACE5GA_04710, partial [Candidatus Zixiibacteriota bacterium]
MPQNLPSDPTSRDSASQSQEVDRRSLDMKRFKAATLDPYLQGQGDHGVVADELSARSLIPPNTARERSFAFISPEIPELDPESC